MRAVRLPDGQAPRNPGEYAYMPYGGWEHKPSFFVGEGEWHIVSPVGGIGAFGRSTAETPTPAHAITEHEDGTITLSPSLVFPNQGWHGFLERDELRAA